MRLNTPYTSSRPSNKDTHTPTQQSKVGSVQVEINTRENTGKKTTEGNTKGNRKAQNPEKRRKENDGILQIPSIRYHGGRIKRLIYTKCKIPGRSMYLKVRHFVTPWISKRVENAKKPKF